MPSVRLPYEFLAPVRTARLALRAMTDEDVDDVHAYQSCPDVCRYLPFEPRTRDEVSEKVAKYSTALALRGDGDFWRLAIERHGDPGRVIGDLYFTIKDAANATCEIGWTLHPNHTGSGYMTEAARAVLRIAFDVLGMHRTSAVLDARNHASAAVCARLGMRKEAHFIEDLWFKGAGATLPSTRSSIENGQRSPPSGSRHAATALDDDEQTGVGAARSLFARCDRQHRGPSRRIGAAPAYASSQLPAEIRALLLANSGVRQHPPSETRIHARAGVLAQFGFMAARTGENQRARAGWGS